MSGTYPVDEECSEMAMQFWEYFLVCVHVYVMCVLKFNCMGSFYILMCIVISKSK